jgi:hypothetical protein
MWKKKDMGPGAIKVGMSGFRTDGCSSAVSGVDVITQHDDNTETF